jgi:hypothetical protein
MKNQHISSENVKHRCIFCLRTDLETPFNKEHVIPDSLKGFLVLYKNVCFDCNSWLGRKVDAQILKVPEIADGFAILGFDKEHVKTIKRHFNITGQLDEEIKLKYGRLKKGEVIFPPQNLPDGSLITSESDAFETLLKKLKRDKRRKNSGFTNERIESDLKELLRNYEKSNVGEKVVADDLGSIIKRSSQPELRIEPKKKANILPLIAKIAYEFYFYISGVKFFNKENRDLRRDLRDIIFQIKGEFWENEKLPNGMFFMREEPVNDDYQKYHVIRLDFHKTIWVLHVSFFGHVQYLLTTNALSKDIIESLINEYKLDDLECINLQLMLDTKELLYGFGTSKGFISYLHKESSDLR